MARRVRRLFRGGRVVDLGAGHGLLAQVMLLLDDSSPAALAVDKAMPASSARLHEALVAAWPRLVGPRVVRRRRARGRRDSARRCRRLEPCLRRADGCRARSRRGRAARASRCCRAVTISPRCDAGALAGWVDGPLAIDIRRAHALEAARLSDLDAGDSRPSRRRTGCFWASRGRSRELPPARTGVMKFLLEWRAWTRWSRHPPSGRSLPSTDSRRRTADRIFRGALIFNTALTVFWAVMLATRSAPSSPVTTSRAMD